MTQEQEMIPDEKWQAAADGFAAFTEGFCPNHRTRLDVCADGHGRCDDCGHCWQLVHVDHEPSFEIVVHIAAHTRGLFSHSDGTLRMQDRWRSQNS